MSSSAPSWAPTQTLRSFLRRWPWDLVPGCWNCGLCLIGIGLVQQRSGRRIWWGAEKVWGDQDAWKKEDYGWLNLHGQPIYPSSSRSEIFLKPFFLSFLQLSTTTCHLCSPLFQIQIPKIRMTKCKVVLLFSGKRKSGKDHITDLLASRLGEQAKILRLARPIFIDKYHKWI